MIWRPRRHSSRVLPDPRMPASGRQADSDFILRGPSMRFPLVLAMVVCPVQLGAQQPSVAPN
jgi:hypothetical protein